MDDPAAVAQGLADELRAHLERGKLAGVILSPSGYGGVKRFIAPHRPMSVS